jgi:cbb3-type cytochrome oxidase maturation protein
MAVIYLLLPVAVILGLAFVVMFIWATRDGQFDDIKTPQIRVLFDDDSLRESKAIGAGGSSVERDHS